MVELASVLVLEIDFGFAQRTGLGAGVSTSLNQLAPGGFDFVQPTYGFDFAQPTGTWGFDFAQPTGTWGF